MIYWLFQSIAFLSIGIFGVVFSRMLLRRGARVRAATLGGFILGGLIGLAAIYIGMPEGQLHGRVASSLEFALPSLVFWLAIATIIGRIPGRLRSLLRI